MGGVHPLAAHCDHVYLSVSLSLFQSPGVHGIYPPADVSIIPRLPVVIFCFVPPPLAARLLPSVVPSLALWLILQLSSSTNNNWAVSCDFKQCGILTSVDWDEPVQPPFKLRNSKWCSVSSLTLIEYSSDKQRLWSDCVYAQAGLRLCWSHIPHCWKSHVAAHMTLR